jgi:hypothetical protein
MAYIVKNTSALINTRLTDTARLKLSQGNFNISYFQIGDSEVSYNTLTGTSYNIANTNILEPNFNSQNSAPGQLNKQNVKYPIYVDSNSNNTYGIPFSTPTVAPIYNRATMRGFFSGDSSSVTSSWSAYTDSKYVINSNYVVDVSTVTGGTQIKIIYSGCNANIVRLPAKGDLITIYFDGNTVFCGTEPIPVTPTKTPTPTQHLSSPYAEFNRLNAVDSLRCRPFALGRQGTVFGEGAAFMLLESEKAFELRFLNEMKFYFCWLLSSSSFYIEIKEN